MSSPYHILGRHYEACLAAHGDSHLGVDWPNSADARTRYAVMLDVARGHPHPRILDLGCGAAHFLEYVLDRGRRLEYVGVDISEAFVEVCRRKHPSYAFHALDVLQHDLPDGQFDFVIMNGLFTEKLTLSDEQMFGFLDAMLRRAFDLAEIGIAFNVMSKLVDWEREDLFHVSFDRLAAFVRRHLSRHFIVRHDYGLFEYTVYVYRSANPGDGSRGR